MLLNALQTNHSAPKDLSRIDDLEKLLKEKEADIQKLRNALESTNKVLKRIEDSLNELLNSERNIQTLSSSFSPSTLASPSAQIQQFDGNDTSPLSDISSLAHTIIENEFECDNCQKPFTSIQDLNQHLEEHQYGCEEEECRICFPSQYQSHLLQLECHPHTDFVRNHILESTKRDFAKRSQMQIQKIILEELGCQIPL